MAIRHPVSAVAVDCAGGALGVDALTNVDLLIDVDDLIESGGLVTELALTEAAQRELLKSAIALHRFRGTPWAIKQALASLGWTSSFFARGSDSWGGVCVSVEPGMGGVPRHDRSRGRARCSIGTASTAVGAVNFFKPARAWLDSIWFAVPAITDTGPLPSDKFWSSVESVKYQLNAAPSPNDNALVFAIAMASLIDPHGPMVSAYDGHYRHSGITYGANEPEVADSALIVNGAAVLHGG